MTNNEIQARIDQLEKQRFYLSMKDRWSGDDFLRDTDLRREILTLKAQLAA